MTVFKRLKIALWFNLLLTVASSAWAGVTVTWTAPADGTLYVTPPATIVLQASATATQSYIVSKVEFFSGSTLIGTATTSPYSFNWNSVPPGTYVLTAKATAIKGTSTQTAISAAATITVNALPLVSITAPAGVTHLSIPPPSVTLEAQASDPDGTVASVQFMSMDANGIEASIATVTTAPYRFDWTIPQPYYYSGGKPQHYFIKAVVTDNRGASTDTGWGTYLQLDATVQLTSPTTGANYAAPASIPLQVAINPADYPTSKVQYYSGTALIGESTTPPYSFTWDNVAAGSYSLTARVVSTAGTQQIPTSPAVAITVNHAAALYFIEVDHLDTPRLVSDAAGTTVWKWDQQEPFGDSVPDENPSGLGTFDLPLRLPGQRYDQETGLHYNYYRDYNPSLGRYGESDPIGLRGGINTYAYVWSIPLRLVDPLGQDIICGPGRNKVGTNPNGTVQCVENGQGPNEKVCATAACAAGMGPLPSDNRPESEVQKGQCKFTCKIIATPVVLACPGPSVTSNLAVNVIGKSLFKSELCEFVCN